MSNRVRVLNGIEQICLTRLPSPALEPGPSTPSPSSGPILVALGPPTAVANRCLGQPRQGTVMLQRGGHFLVKTYGVNWQKIAGRVP